jgi:hypothetical protein
MLESNAILAWRRWTYDAVTTTLTPTQRETFDLKFAEINQTFPLHSYNEATDGGPSLPYDAVVVAPERVYAGSFEVDPENIALQLHYGCLEADLMMQEDFHMNSMKEKCEERFPKPTPKPAHSKKN